MLTYRHLIDSRSLRPIDCFTPFDPHFPSMSQSTLPPTSTCVSSVALFSPAVMTSCEVHLAGRISAGTCHTCLGPSVCLNQHSSLHGAGQSRASALAGPNPKKTMSHCISPPEASPHVILVPATILLTLTVYLLPPIGPICLRAKVPSFSVTAYASVKTHLSIVMLVINLKAHGHIYPSVPFINTQFVQSTCIPIYSPAR